MVSVAVGPKVNWSAATIGDVPPGVVSNTSWVPATPKGAAGAVAVHEVVDAQVTTVAADPPKVAVVVNVPDTKPVPVTVTTVPAVERAPAAGTSLVTSGDP